MTDIPDLLHYQQFHEGRLRQLLIERKLYMSSPSAFNDPWDCQPHFDVQQVNDPAYRDKLADYFGKVVVRQPRNRPMQYLMERIEEIRQSPEAAVKEVLRQSEGIRKGLAEQWRVYCLTPHADSELMWSHYGDSHRGIAVQFNGAGPWARQASRVCYLNDYPSIDILDLQDGSQKILLSKSAAWAYEHEHRVLAWDRKFAPSGAEVPLTDGNLASLPDGSLSSIVLGASANEATEATVLAVVAESGLDLVVQRATLFRNRYGLTFSRVR